MVTKASAAGLIAAGLLSVIIFPALGLTLLRRDQPAPAGTDPAPIPTPATPVLTAEDAELCRVGNGSARAMPQPT